jgi:hypothetical protein
MSSVKFPFLYHLQDCLFNGNRTSMLFKDNYSFLQTFKQKCTEDCYWQCPCCAQVLESVPLSVRPQENCVKCEQKTQVNCKEFWWWWKHTKFLKQFCSEYWTMNKVQKPSKTHTHPSKVNMVGTLTWVVRPCHLKKTDIFQEHSSLFIFWLNSKPSKKQANLHCWRCRWYVPPKCW